ncbi:Sodium/potassium/calcium exchanger 1 [Strongyloides ratti]|uniref:Sodium/potassium/calcium exchanger 1 n=1 Tax=Strongyloides ratti TaxID=34506 RepID=A0A090LGC2_STRRB|nr:Sodium/potassium/calcium exchanger 1 [Strongyloides ratti]CEF68807.1 Sodium/potassium/calcium exchanger 1 [Strongyloides ratti]
MNERKFSIYQNRFHFLRKRRRIQRKIVLFGFIILIIIAFFYLSFYIIFLNYFKNIKLEKNNNNHILQIYKDSSNQKEDSSKIFKNNNIYKLLFPISKFYRKKRDIYSDYEYDTEKSLKLEGCPLSVKNPTNTTTTEVSLFPEDLFTQQQRLNGAIILHVIGLFYMFTALAIVCDEFFVPALGVITEMLLISNDVAGATFMAAGGSMPEFFTSVFGVFITSNNVGIGTIVGSATFNILCVLAFCTLFSKQVLKLTWWPLFRDITFYITSLFFLVIFFLDEKILWYEALILFIIYILYAIFMKYNESIECYVKERLFFCPIIKKESIDKDQQLINKAIKKKRNSFQVARIKNISNDMHSDGTSHETVSPSSEQATIPVLHAGTFFRQSLAQMALDIGDETSRSIEDGHAIHKSGRRKSSSSGDKQAKTIIVKAAPENATLNYCDGDKKKFDPPKIKKVGDCTTIKKNNRPKNDEKHAKITNAPPVVSIIVEPQSSDTIDDEENNYNNNNINDNDDIIKEEDDEPLDLTWPKTRQKQLVYLILFPITYSLYLTLPDVRRTGYKKYVVVTFIGSILWIALFSYLMVWWSARIGSTFGIPTEIMGLTILAAGTSIPDLITSVIVARKGLGDMAVSSSIGSNLFDVCVGLPIPWLLYFLVNWIKKNQIDGEKSIETISVSSNGLVCSVGLLFLMLLILIFSVGLSRWQMNKIFGIIMIVAYICFCIFSVFLEIGYLVCPLKFSISEKC